MLQDAIGTEASESFSKTKEAMKRLIIGSSALVVLALSAEVYAGGSWIGRQDSRLLRRPSWYDSRY
jgi:hypothetical protein